MNIHEESRIKSISDSMLWKKMLAFAVPYWKSISVSFLFALLIAVTAILQPLIVKSAIDDRIKGITKPMVYAEDAGAEKQLEKDDRVYGKPVAIGDRIYYRAKQDEASWPQGVMKAQIVPHDGHYDVVDGWVEDSENVTITHAENGSGQLAENNEALELRQLAPDELKAFRKQDISGLIILGALFLVNVVLAGLFTYWQSLILQNTGQKIIYDMRSRMFEKLAKLQTSYYDRNPVGRLVTRVAYDVEAMNQLYSQVIVNLAKELLLLVGIAGIMLFLNVKLALVSFTVIPLLLVCTIYFKGIIRDAQQKARILLSRLNSFLAESLSGMGIIQMFTRESKQLEQFDKLNNAYYEAGMKGTTNNSIFNPLIGFLGNLALAVVVWYGGHSILASGVTFGIVFAFTSYIRQFFQPLTALSDRFTQIQTALASAERIVELLEEKPTITSRSDAHKLSEPLQGALEFKHVWFAYEAEHWVLRDISFSVNPGETIAFVGATGAGKSSIIGLVNRFYDVQQGSVRLDGKELRELDLKQVRTSIGVIQQEPFVFSGNVYDNIRMNKGDVSDEEIRMAAKALRMEDFIERLPNGYDTMLGEQGIKLSSGQQQLLAFLRVYVSNPHVLVLDEATAHVDTETEQTLQKGLLQLSKGRTTLIVAHRLSTIRHADKIIVMHKGSIQQMGSHDELMAAGGAYRKLYELQNGAAAAPAPISTAQ
ncbi:ABC transporter ATP-binding protein [Paenibacillus sp. HB172176]|uniref:ABC transporter ATP-binding protein n=1 Tax=Paenibacillus sp. HB172176 TaxID=2493690 RepID=UPI0014398B34|nr:ABC transporter ATP-binding protein [Paenibacillus sp. HB172176]